MINMILRFLKKLSAEWRSVLNKQSDKNLYLYYDNSIFIKISWK